MKSTDNFHLLQDKEQISELTIKVSALPLDTVHGCTHYLGTWARESGSLSSHQGSLLTIWVVSGDSIDMVLIRTGG